MEKWLGQDVPKLGFGMMRLPAQKDGAIDLPQVRDMVDAFMGAGFTYFDTAYGYHNEQSEPTVRKALVERYPREQYLLATKLPLWHIKTAADMPRLFATQIERTAAGYFDYYLLHALNASYLKMMDETDTWGFIRRLRDEGKVRHIGFSFHDSADVLEDVLTKHPEMEFVQLQINYADWDSGAVQSRACYETARRHGKSVVIMEPVKGGALAAMGPDARAVLLKARPDASIASWAMRYAASLDGVITVLSGMSDMEQMRDNIHTLANFEPLTGDDRAALDNVRDILSSIQTIPCTNCKYCIEAGNCPQGIPIPEIIATDNNRRVFDRVDKGSYAFATRGKGVASDCIRCGACEGRCPQHLPIMQLMEDAAAVYES